MTAYDAAIIGGGVAGPALAIHLARAGRRVVLFEKEKGAHDKVCGEFISQEGVCYLKELGVSPGELGSVPIRHVRLARHGEPVTANLPFEAQSLSRRVLDETLLQLAAAAGAEIRRGHRVTDIEKGNDAWTVHLDGVESVEAKQAFLATGKLDLKGFKRTRGQHPECIAFKTYWRLKDTEAAELAQHVELILFPGGYAGLQEVEGGRANLCLIVRNTAYAERYRSWEALLDATQEHCPHLKKRLDGAISLMDKPLAISGMPYGHVAWESGGVWRVGDQAATIPSFTGDGISIALHSARRAAHAFLKDKSSEIYQRTLAQQLSSQLYRATVISRMLVSETGQSLAITSAGIFPYVLPASAGLTRIPSRALDDLREGSGA